MPLSKSTLTIILLCLFTFSTLMFSHISLSILKVLLTSLCLFPSLAILLRTSLYILLCYTFASMGCAATSQFHYGFFSFVYTLDIKYSFSLLFFYYYILSAILCTFNFTFSFYSFFVASLLLCFEISFVPHISQLFPRDKFLFPVFFCFCTFILAPTILYKCYYLPSCCYKLYLAISPSILRRFSWS